MITKPSLSLQLMVIPCGFRLCLQGLEIGEVFFSSHGRFIGDELFPAKKNDRDAAIGPFLAMAGGIFPRDRGNGCDQINADRRPAELNDLIGLGEVRGLESQSFEAEVREGGEDAGGVFRGRMDPKVQVARVAGRAVESERVSAHDQVFNAMGVE